MAVDPVSLAITIALNVASMALTASKKIEGPRLTDLKTTTADYGTPMVQFYGTKRLECFCMYAEDIREERHQNKTKGGKYNEYKYFGTWANFIADNPIDGVLQVWLDRHIVYDRTGTGAVSPLYGTAQGGGLEGGGNFRVYLGTEDQGPDPRLLAKIEAKEGPGTCPAYLGIAYMVFEEIPLDPFGNRLPQVSCEATRSIVPSFPWEQHTSGIGFLNGHMATSPSWLAYYGSGAIQWWDLPGRTPLGIGGHGPEATSTNIELAANGTAYAYDWAFRGLDVYVVLQVTPPLGATVATEVDTDGWGHTFVFDVGGVTTVLGTLGSDGFNMNSAKVTIGTSGRGFLLDDEDEIWAITQPSGSSNLFGLYRLSDGHSIGFAGTATRSAQTFPQGCFVASTGNFFIATDGYFYIIDRETEVVTSSGPVIWPSTASLPYRDPTRGSFWALGGLSAEQFSLVDGSLIQTEGGWAGAPSSVLGGIAYDTTDNALVYEGGFSSDLVWLFLDRASGGPWTLGAICADVADQCGMRTTEYDFSDLDQLVPGYAWTQGAGKDVVGVLLDLHDSDVRPHGFVQQGLKRGKTYAAGTISTDWMVNDQRGGDAAQSPLYSIPITSETDMPLRLAATFADPNNEEQPNTATAQRNAASVKTNREQTFDLTTLAQSADELQPLLERALRRYWVGSAKPQFLLTPLEIRLEPADVRPLLLEDGELLRVRATKVTIRANRVIDTEWEVDGETQVDPPSWELDNASPLSTVYSTPGGFTYGRTPETVPILVPTKGFVFDTPLLFDADDQTSPFLYDAAGTYSDSAIWIGAMVWTAAVPTDPYSGNWDAFASSEASTWGQCSTTLPDASTDVVDEGSTLDVTLIGGGSLSSITEEALLASSSANLALVGSELIQFRDATLIATNKYRLGGLVRGARNTEYAVSDHAAGETFLLIGSHAHKRTVGASEIGDTDYYRFSSTGLDLDTSSVLTVTFAANAHRPPAPAHLELTRNTGTGDWLIDWIRRTRIGGSAVNGQDVPLGETSELYRVKIMNGATVVKSYDVTSPSLTYTNAEQTADWGSAQTHLTVEVCQMSTALSLEGFSSAASG